LLIYLFYFSDNRYTFTQQEGKQEKQVTKKVLLDEHDFLWPKLRHMHIADCINRVIDDFNGFLKTNKAVALNHEQNRKVTTLKVRPPLSFPPSSLWHINAYRKYM